MDNRTAVRAVDRDSAESLQDLVLVRLDQVFHRLREDSIPFCLLRNRHVIPSGLVERSDVDLVVPSDVSADRILTLFADLQPVHVFRRRILVSLYFPVGPIFLLVDFFNCDQEWRGARYLENREILADAWEDRGIPVASKIHQAFSCLVHKLLYEGAVPIRYASLIACAALEYPETFQGLLERRFGPQLRSELWEMARAGRTEPSSRLAARCRRSLWLRAARQRPLATIHGLATLGVQGALLRMHPPGLDVAILGPDGAGKSALCSAIASAPRVNLPFKSVEILERYARILPRLSTMPRGLQRTPFASTFAIGDYRDPQGRPVYSPLASVAKLAYYAADRWLWNVRSGHSKRLGNALLLHDRHALEIAVDPKRYRYGGPLRLARFAARLVPQPDLVILLDAPAEVLQARKQEVSFAETVRQREAYRALVDGLPNGRVVDASRPLPEVVAEVKALIVEHLAVRTARLLGQRVRP